MPEPAPEPFQPRPRAAVQLPPKPAQPPPRDSRKIALVFAVLAVPGAGLAGATGLQRWLEGAEVSGDALGRWLLFASALSLVAGAIAGLLLSKRGLSRALWTAWGACSPALLALTVAGAVHAARPLRQAFAARSAARCHDSGRLLCSVREFRDACLRRDMGPLGAPNYKKCSGDECTLRFHYEGPWGLDDYVPPGRLVCSIVTGVSPRSALTPGDDPDR